jgi:antitoxin (DNA-binding transcriptional repressor) of toxin-antitoxin stability system
MRTVEISQAADSLPEYGRRKRGETWVLTRRGRPVAAVVPIDDEDYFSMRLANDPRFIEIIERSRARYKATGGTSLAEMRRKYGVPAKPRRRPAPRKPR